MRHGEFGEKAKFVLLDIFKREIIAAHCAGQTYLQIATQYGVGKATMYRFIKEVV
jgi:transposase-like protein